MFTIRATLQRSISSTNAKHFDTQRSNLRLPKCFHIEPAVLVGGPAAGAPLFRGTRDNFFGHVSVPLFGVTGSYVPKKLTLDDLLIHKMGVNLGMVLASTSSDPAVATHFAGRTENPKSGSVAKYDSGSVPTIATEKTLIQAQKIPTHSATEQEFTALFLLAHALIEVDYKGDVIPNPFHLSFNLESSIDRKLIEVLQNIHDVWYETLVAFSEKSMNREEVGRLLARHVSELIYLYDEKCGKLENPFRKSTEEFKTLSSDHLAYAQHMERNGSAGFSESGKSIIDLVSKESRTGIDPDKCCDLFVKDHPYFGATFSMSVGKMLKDFFSRSFYQS